MPLLSPSEPTGTLRQLDAGNLTDSPGSKVGGIGLSAAAYRQMSFIIAGRRMTLDQLQASIQAALSESGVPAGSVNNLNVQNTAVAHAAVMGQIRSTVPLATGSQDRFWPPTDYTQVGRLAGTMPPSHAVDLSSVIMDVQQSARQMFTVHQTLSLNKMISDWLGLIQDLIDTAAEAESDLGKIVSDINTERQAVWALVGGVLGAALTYTLPPPAGAIVGAVVASVCTETSWTKAAAGAAKLGVQANQPVSSSSGVLGAYEVPTLYGQEKMTDYKDWFATIGGAPSCLGKSSRDVFEKVNKKTLNSLTMMPPPPKAQAQEASKVIRYQCGEKMQAIFQAVSDEMVDFVSTQSGPAMLVQASWEFQESAIASRVKFMKGGDRAAFVKEAVKQGALYYLNTAAHEILSSIADGCKAKYTRQTFDKKAVKKDFEILFMANYLGSTALKEPKATTTFGGKAPRVGDEDYYAYNYGTIKKLVWKSQLEDKLNELGITKKFAPKSSLPFAGRSGDYSSAIAAWRPPLRQGEWIPVPYQDGGSNNTKGRLAAWAVEYTKRSPTALFSWLQK